MKAFSRFSFFITTVAAIYFLENKYKIDFSEKFSDLLSFLSIAIGFCITSLSLIATTKFSRNLYEIESGKSSNRTLLHELVEHFQMANKFFLVSIILIIAYLLFEKLIKCEIKIGILSLSIHTILQSFITYFIVASLFKFYKLTRLIELYIIQAAKKQ